MIPKTQRKATESTSPPGRYSVRKGAVRVDGFDSFHDAYLYALNRFCSEDFLVWSDGWRTDPRP